MVIPGFARFECLDDGAYFAWSFSRDAMVSTAAALREFASSKPGSHHRLVFQTPGGDAQVVAVRVTSSALAVTIEGQVLEVGGHSDGLEILASNFEALAGYPAVCRSGVRSHVHVEHFDGFKELAPGLCLEISYIE